MISLNTSICKFPPVKTQTTFLPLNISLFLINAASGAAPAPSARLCVCSSKSKIDFFKSSSLTRKIF